MPTSNNKTVQKAQARKRASGKFTLALKPRADVARSPKQGSKKDVRPPKNFKKKTRKKPQSSWMTTRAVLTAVLQSGGGDQWNPIPPPPHSSPLPNPSIPVPSLHPPPLHHPLPRPVLRNAVDMRQKIWKHQTLARKPAICRETMKTAAQK